MTENQAEKTAGRLSQQERDALRRLESEATPGDWRVVHGTTHLELRAPHQTDRSVARVYCDIDADFVAAIRGAAKQLFDMADALAAAEARIEELEGRVANQQFRLAMKTEDMNGALIEQAVIIGMREARAVAFAECERLIQLRMTVQGTTECRFALEQATNDIAARRREVEAGNGG